jgi:hypothetical protein
MEGAAAATVAAAIDPHHPSLGVLDEPSRLQEEKEEFFDRAMRERQEEVQRISQSMRKVQEIYTVRLTLGKRLRRGLIVIVMGSLTLQR